jgi:hypothetical protein
MLVVLGESQPKLLPDTKGSVFQMSFETLAAFETQPLLLGFQMVNFHLIVWQSAAKTLSARKLKG